MLDKISEIFGQMGVKQVQIGKTKYDIAEPESLSCIEGYGDTIQIGDIFYNKVTYNKSFQEWVIGDKSIEGPFKLIGTGPIAETNFQWFLYSRIDGSRTTAHVAGNGWERSFKLADSETAEKVKSALKYDGLYLRTYVRFMKEEYNNNTSRLLLIPVCWIVWVGNLKEALTTYNSPYGKLKLKNIVKWIKSKFYKDAKIKSGIDIPSDFPINIDL